MFYSESVPKNKSILFKIKCTNRKLVFIFFKPKVCVEKMLQY